MWNETKKTLALLLRSLCYELFEPSPQYNPVDQVAPQQL